MILKYYSQVSRKLLRPQKKGLQELKISPGKEVRIRGMSPLTGTTTLKLELSLEEYEKAIQLKRDLLYLYQTTRLALNSN